MLSTRQLLLRAVLPASILLPVSILLPGAPAAIAASSPAALGDAASAAQADLDRSTRELSELRARISAEKLPLTKELASLEEQLARLRRRSEEIARSQDTANLDVTNLGAAMKLRQDETVYVSNLLDEYARGFESTLNVSERPRWSGKAAAAKDAAQNPDLTLERKLEVQADLLDASLDRVDDLLGGTRFPGDAVDPGGNVESGQFALVGPVLMFAGKGGIAGIALSQGDSDTAAVRPLAPELNAGLALVANTGDGFMPFDPSRGGALQELVSRWSLFGTFKKGGPIMWPLLVVSILAVSVILERLLFLARTRRARDRKAVEKMFARVEAGDVEGAIQAGRKSGDYIARALTYALDHRAKSLVNGLDRAAGQELVKFIRGIAILDTCVTMAPLLGLLGTVTGMMGAFGTLGGSDLSAPAQITGGIAEALIATAFGLIIAVSAMIPMNYLHTKADEARHLMEDACTRMELLMKPLLDAERRFLESPATASPALAPLSRPLMPGAPQLERA